MDAFALLGLPRRAALDAEEVRAAFQKAGAAQHPDHAETSEKADRAAGFTALNEAQAMLTSPPRRLRLLLELLDPETAAARTGAVMDGEMMDIFSLTGAAVQQAQSVLARKQQAASALARAMLAGEEMQAQEAIESALTRVESARDALRAVSEEIDATLTTGGDASAALQSAAARAGFLEKWHQQLRNAFAAFFAA